MQGGKLEKTRHLSVNLWHLQRCAHFYHLHFIYGGKRRYGNSPEHPEHSLTSRHVWSWNTHKNWSQPVDFPRGLRRLLCISQEPHSSMQSCFRHFTQPLLGHIKDNPTRQMRKDLPKLWTGLPDREETHSQPHAAEDGTAIAPAGDKRQQRSHRLQTSLIHVKRGLLAHAAEG